MRDGEIDEAKGLLRSRVLNQILKELRDEALNAVRTRWDGSQEHAMRMVDAGRRYDIVQEIRESLEDIAERETE